MRNVKLIIEYDGTGYCGWQVQKNAKNSIQGVVERVLEGIVGHRVKVIAAGRTDKGVHSLGQTVNFKTGCRIPAGNIKAALNSLLPRDISVLRAEDVFWDFHSRYGAKNKTYCYLILNRGEPSPLLRNRAYPAPYRLNLARMRLAAGMLVGRHNFRAFCASGSSATNTVRVIERVSIRRGPGAFLGLRQWGDNAGLIAVYICGNGFLYNMVRSIAGTLLDIGRGKKDVGIMEEILQSGRRALIGPTLPAYGLYLCAVDY